MTLVSQQESERLQDRLHRLEKSLELWKRVSFVVVLVLACAFFMAAEDNPAVSSFNIIRADTVAAKSFVLVEDGQEFGAITVHKAPDGSPVPTFNLTSNKKTFYVAIEPNQTIMGFDVSEKPVFDVRAFADSTILQVSRPSGGVGVMLAASKDRHGDILVQKDNGLVSLAHHP